MKWRRAFYTSVSMCISSFICISIHKVREEGKKRERAHFGFIY